MMATPAEQPSLTVLSGSMGGTVFVVDDSVDNVLIGSDASCRFAIPDAGVDPIHARLWIDLEGITVYDTDSPHGVYINDDRVEGQARLRNGDILWLGRPGDDTSVMLQCRIPAPAHEAPPAPPPVPPSTPPDVEPTVSMMASDLEAEPTVALPPVPPAEPEPEVEHDFEPPAAAEAEAHPAPEADVEPVPEREFSIDETPPPSGSLLAPDAIQDEPTVMMAPEEAFIEPDATVSMLPDDEELATIDPEPTVALPPPVPAPAPAAGGWDPLAGGITTAADMPWMAGAPAPDAFDPTATIAARPPTPPAAPPAAKPAPPAAPVAAAAAATGAAAASRAATPAPTAPRAPERPPAPKPRREAAPATAAPTPRRREPPPPPRPPADDEEPPAPSRKGAPIGLLIGGALAAAILVGVGAWWVLGRAASVPEAATTPPPTVAEARPVPPPVTPAEGTAVATPAPDVPVEEEVTIVPPRPGVSPTPVPSRAPSAAPTPTQVARATPPPVTAPAGPAPGVLAAGLVTRAEAARHSGDLDAAGDLFDQALRSDPQNAAATAGKAAVALARVAARKTFMPGRTVVQTQSAKADLSGFDTADVSVKKAPDFSGRIEFAVSPARVKPGDAYSVQVFLVNEGKKAIKVSSASAITNVNGSKSPRALAPRVKEVAPAQRALLDEMAGVWGDDVNWWSAEVTVAANKGDSLKNTINWK